MRPFAPLQAQQSVPEQGLALELALEPEPTRAAATGQPWALPSWRQHLSERPRLRYVRLLPCWDEHPSLLLPVAA